MIKHYLLYGILVLVCCQSNIAFSQTLSVTGVVRDETNAPIPGVNIVVKGTTAGSITDGDGKYSVTVPNGNAVLVFTFIGYADQEVSVADRTQIDVSMTADITSLDEVVVTALGIERTSKSLGYSTSKVNGDAIAI